jgi:hypothetical protein
MLERLAANVGAGLVWVGSRLVAWSISRALDDAPYVCPGCYTVGGGPCAPGCIDAEIEAQNALAYDRDFEEEWRDNA